MEDVKVIYSMESSGREQCKGNLLHGEQWKTCKGNLKSSNLLHGEQ